MVRLLFVGFLIKLPLIPIHPNADGYRALAEGVRDLLRAAEGI